MNGVAAVAAFSSSFTKQEFYQRTVAYKLIRVVMDF